MAYPPIEDHGIIGDMRSCALVSTDATIAWFCPGRFDAPTVFASLLDEEKGGSFTITPAEREYSTRQHYWPDTNVLLTRILGEHGSVEIADFMPVPHAGGDAERRQIVRRLRCVRGSMRLRVRCAPAFNFARDAHATVLAEGGAEFRSRTASLSLATNTPLTRDKEGAAVAELTLHDYEEAVFVLRDLGEGESCPSCISPDEAELLFRETVRYWRSWISHCTYTGRWREMVRRSALCLKLLTYEPTGAIIAAPTTSLPEAIGGERNWDYRYTWVRDAAFTIYALLRVGFSYEASGFMHFLSGLRDGRAPTDAPLQVLYTIDGKTHADEETLDHLDGYRSSKPVRIGNGAHDQLQLDIFGELLDGAYLFNKWGEPVSIDFWRSLSEFVDWVCDNWQREDHGLWEVRGEKRHFVFSKLMCWVAVDRGLRLADKRSFPAPNRARWLETRDRIMAEIMERGWSEKLGAFRMFYEEDSLDAALLIMPLVFFLSPTDPRMLSTLEAIMRTPEEGGLSEGSLVYRYNTEEGVDGLEGREATFNMCTFWLVEALTRAGHFRQDRLDEARIIFERMLSFANHLGLYAEETGLRGEALGNFPQAFTHISLISAAFNLDRALNPS